MAYLTFKGVGVTAMSAAVPHHVINNYEYTEFFPAEEVKQVVDKIGIYERRFADPDTCSSDLCFAAAEKLLEDNRRQIENDLKAIEPAERVRLYAALLNYVIPKQQAVTVEAAMQAEYEELTKLLKTAPDAAIDKIADRIKEIEGYNNGQ